jgi:hypothetical protein
MMKHYKPLLSEIKSTATKLNPPPRKLSTQEEEELEELITYGADLAARKLGVDLFDLFAKIKFPINKWIEQIGDINSIGFYGNYTTLNIKETEKGFFVIHFAGDERQLYLIDRKNLNKIPLDLKQAGWTTDEENLITIPKSTFVIVKDDKVDYHDEDEDNEDEEPLLGDEDE